MKRFTAISLVAAFLLGAGLTYDLIRMIEGKTSKLAPYNYAGAEVNVIAPADNEIESLTCLEITKEQEFDCAPTPFPE